MSDELVVTDADREAAAEYWAQSSAIPCGENHDQPDGSLLAQAFARHRTKALAAIQASLPDEVNAMVEKCRRIGASPYPNGAEAQSTLLEAAAMLTRLSARIADLEAQIARDKAEWVEIPRLEAEAAKWREAALSRGKTINGLKAEVARLGDANDPATPD